MQARYFLLGNYGNSITLDWATVDYKFAESVGVRFGKVKTPMGLLNETQDIDPSYIWALLPQSVYAIGSRNSVLSHMGGVVYGTVDLSQSLGKVEYRGWGGERVVGSNDGYFLNYAEAGITFPNGIHGVNYGAALHWRPPVAGLMVGLSDNRGNREQDNVEMAGIMSGKAIIGPLSTVDVFGRYEENKLMIAGEHERVALTGTLEFPVLAQQSRIDWQSWYAMASYRLTGKLTAGMYHSQQFDRQAALGPARYSKDWNLAARYDFNEFLYLKAEEHFVDGTELDYDYAANGVMPGAPSPAKYSGARLTILKIGVSF